MKNIQRRKYELLSEYKAEKLYQIESSGKISHLLSVRGPILHRFRKYDVYYWKLYQFWKRRLQLISQCFLFVEMAHIIEQSFSRGQVKDNRASEPIKALSGQKSIFYEKILKLIVGLDSQILDLSIIDDCFLFRILIHNHSLGIRSFQTILVDFRENKLMIRMATTKNSHFFSTITQKKSNNIYPSLNHNHYHLIKICLQPGNGLLAGSSNVQMSRKINLYFIAKTLSTMQRQLDQFFILLLAFSNQIPANSLLLLKETKRHNCQNFLTKESFNLYKIQNYLQFSQGKIKQIQKSRNKVAFQISQKQQFLTKFERTLIKNSNLFHHIFFHKEFSPSTHHLTNYGEQISMYLRVPPGLLSRSFDKNNYIYNQCLIKDQKNIEVTDSGFRGGSSKILLSNLEIKYKIGKEGQNLIFGSQQFFKFSRKQKLLQDIYHRKSLAIKESMINSERFQQKARNQLRILEKFALEECAFILKHYSSNQADFPHKNRVMMDYFFDSQTFSSYLARFNQTLSFPKKLMILGKVIHGLFFMHKNGVYHMDMSSGNILLSRNITKIIDFGQSYHKDLHEKDQGYEPGYTLPFTPPQRFISKNYTQKYDIYCFAVILSRMVLNGYPYNRFNSLKYDLASGSYRKKMFLAPESTNYEYNQNVMNLIIQIIDKGLRENVSERPDSSWLVLILKEMHFWLEDYMSFSFG